MIVERVDLTERLSRALDEAIEQEHFARMRWGEASQAVWVARERLNKAEPRDEGDRL